MKSGWPRRGMMLIRPLTGLWFASNRSIPEPWSACARTGKNCWRSMTSRQNIGFTSAQTNPIESTFATVRLRTQRARNCGSRETTLAMVYKLLESAQRNWKRIKGFDLLALVVNNVKFKDGEQVQDQSGRNAA